MGKNEEKHYIKVNNEKVYVSDEVYYAYMRYDWNEAQRIKRNKRCNIGKSRCYKDCSKCKYTRTGSNISLEELYNKAQYEIPCEEDPADIIMKKEQHKQLRLALNHLSPKDQKIMLMYAEGASDNKIAKSVGMSDNKWIKQKIQNNLNFMKKFF